MVLCDPLPSIISKSEMERGLDWESELQGLPLTSMSKSFATFEASFLPYLSIKTKQLHNFQCTCPFWHAIILGFLSPATHLRSFLSFSSFPYFSAAARAQFSLHLLNWPISPSKASSNHPVPFSNIFTELSHQGLWDLPWQSIPVSCHPECFCMPQEMAQPGSLSQC